jgi:hypothetical protein
MGYLQPHQGVEHLDYVNTIPHQVGMMGFGGRWPVNITTHNVTRFGGSFQTLSSAPRRCCYRRYPVAASTVQCPIGGTMPKW